MEIDDRERAIVEKLQQLGDLTNQFGCLSETQIVYLRAWGARIGSVGKETTVKDVQVGCDSEQKIFHLVLLDDTKSPEYKPEVEFYLRCKDLEYQIQTCWGYQWRVRVSLNTIEQVVFPLPLGQVPVQPEYKVLPKVSIWERIKGALGGKNS